MSDFTQLNLLRSQALLHLVNANVSYCTWPRAGGKTSGGSGPRIVHLSEVMPRSQIILYSDTFERLHDRIVPGILSFIETEMGLVEGQDFMRFKKPPDTFTKPLIPLTKFDHVIPFSSGFTICCASQKVSGSANAYNAQALIVDEAKFIKPESLNTEVLPAIRGANKYFGHLPEYRSQWYFTDKWGENISWILKKRELMNVPLVKAVITLQIKIYELEAEMENAQSTKTKYKYKAQIIDIEQKLNRIRKELIYFSDAEPYENREILGEKYFRDQRRDLKPLEFEVAILNQDPDKVEHSFYPAYSTEKHDYYFDNDINMNAPISVALDYQWRIVPLTAGQFNILPGELYTTFNVIAATHTLYENEGSIEKTITEFCALMKSLNYTLNIVNYVYDHTATSKSPANKPFYILVEEAFLKNGWSVHMINIGKASEHPIRFESIKNMMMKEGEDAVRFNHARTRHLRKAIQLAGAVSSSGKTKKDKTKEKNLSVPAVETTDYTESFDQLVWAALELRMIPQGMETGFEIAVR